jgi:predicted negative regulator of RcsB-dependent stress response
MKLSNIDVSAGFLLCLLCGQLNAEPEDSSRPQLERDNQDLTVELEDQSGGSTGKIESYLEQAKNYYQKKRYAEAKSSFQQALTVVLQQPEATQEKFLPALYYNLGSVCYRLEQYEQSRAYFEKLTGNKNLNAVAYYNIALIENKQGDKEAAIDAFNTGRSLSLDPQLSGLIDEQLKKLVKQPPVKRKLASYKDWHSYVYLSYGYDSNIKFAPLEVASNESGDFVQAIGTFDKVIAGKGTGKKQPALLFTSSVFLSNYFSTDFNDYNLFDIGLRYAFPVSKWRNRLDFNVKKSTYGHEDYQRITSATYRTTRYYKDKDFLLLRYRYEQIDSLDARYDYLEGSRHRFTAEYRFRWPQDSLRLWYELEVNDRENTVNRNYSPTRNTVRLRYEKDINASNKVYGEYEYRHSDYEPTAVQDREDDRSTFLLAYVNDIAPDWQLLARWRYRTNRSTDNVFSYDRHVSMLTLRKLF